MVKIRQLKQSELLKIDPNLRNDHPKSLLAEIFKIEFKKLFYGTGFQKERDLFIGCLFAFYCRKLQNREWFIQRISDPPDFELTAPTNRKIKEKPFDHAQVEIVQITERVKSLSEAIEIIKTRKIERPYDLGRDVILLIFLNNPNGPNWSYGLADFFQQVNDKYSEIFAIYFLKGDTEDQFIYEVKSIRPQGSKETLNLREELSKKPIPHPLIDRFAAKINEE